MKRLLVSSWLLLNLNVALPLAYAAESDVDSLVNLLIQKGTITQEEAADFRASLAVKKQDEKDAQQEFAISAGRPVKFSAYTQVLFKQDQSALDTFQVRRARIDIKSNVTERFDYRLQTDFAGASAKVLDATIGYTFGQYLKLTLGQFKVPLSLENLTSSPKLETINRSQVVEALTARGKDVIGNHNGRDTGFQTSGNLFLKEDFNLIEYSAGVFNGSGINTTDVNEQKDIAARLVFHPLKSIAVGGSYYAGSYVPAAKTETRSRAGGELSYINGYVSLKGEYLQGTDIATDKDGWYAQLGYFVLPKKLQTVAKYDYYDPNKKTANNETLVYTYGINWYFVKSSFVQVNYEQKTEKTGETANDSLLAQFTLQL